MKNYPEKNYGVLNPNGVVVSFRLPKALIEAVDALAHRETRTRVNMVQVLLQEALESRDRREKEQQEQTKRRA